MFFCNTVCIVCYSILYIICKEECQCGSTVAGSSGQQWDRLPSAPMWTKYLSSGARFESTAAALQNMVHLQNVTDREEKKTTKWHKTTRKRQKKATNRCKTTTKTDCKETQKKGKEVQNDYKEMEKNYKTHNMTSNDVTMTFVVVVSFSLCILPLCRRGGRPFTCLCPGAHFLIIHPCNRGRFLCKYHWIKQYLLYILIY